MFIAYVSGFYPGYLHGSQMPEYESVQSISEGLSAPTAVAVGIDGKVYVTESSSNSLIVFTEEGSYVKERTDLNRPLGLAVSRTGEIYVCSAGKQNVEIYDETLKRMSKLGMGDGEFSRPVSIAVAGTGNVYVADGEGNVIKVYGPDGSFRFSFGEYGNGDGQFYFPTSVSIDGVAGEVVVTDLQLTDSGSRGARIQVFSLDGIFKRSFGSYGQSEGQLTKPMGVAVDGGGRVHVSDSYQNVVQVFDGTGSFLGVVQSQANPLRTPLGLCINGTSGRLYIASLNTGSVEVYGTGVQDPGGDGDPGGGGDPGGDGDPGSGGGTGGGAVTGSSGGGACSIEGGRPETGASRTGWLFPLMLTGALYFIIRRRKRAG